MLYSKLLIIFLFFLSQTLNLFGQISISGEDLTYKKICARAATEDSIFTTFCSNPDYSHIVECGSGELFASYIFNNCRHLMPLFSEFQKLESIGDPKVDLFETLGFFSGTTLHIVVADHIQKLFKLPPAFSVVEIGAGFGGQCFVLSKISPFSNYIIYDLPEVEVLIEKTLKKLFVKNFQCLPFSSEPPLDKIDLVISNYAFSECERSVQMNYFDKVIKKSDRGYVIYNDFSKSASFGETGTLTAQEFFNILSLHGMNPKIQKELVETAPSNVLITWDRTQAEH